jgi:hypothetical protein
MNENTSVDPWVVQAPKQVEQVPNGFYNAEFKGVVEVKLEDGSLKWRFEWEVKSGPEKGKLATALCDQKINADTLPGRLIAGLLGHTPLPGERVKDAIEACKGKMYLVNVQPGPKGGKPGVKSCGQPPAM